MLPKEDRIRDVTKRRNEEWGMGNGEWGIVVSGNI